MELSKIKNNSVIFCTNRDKLEILKTLNQKSLFLNLSFIDTFDNYVSIRNNYYFYMLNNYDIPYDLANKLKRYFPYIDTLKTYKSDKLNELRVVIENLLDRNILETPNVKFTDNSVYTINKMPIPSFIEKNEIEEVVVEYISDNDITLNITETALDSSYCAFEKTIELLEEGININDIVLLNTTSEDDYNLNKIFQDSSIPIVLNKSIKLNTYPEVISLIKIITEKGYLASKKHLDSLIKSTSDSHYLPVLIRIYNDYLDSDLEANPKLLIEMINNQSVPRERYSNCINVYPIDRFSYDSKKHYIIMNYSDNSIPKTANTSHYLNADELEEIGYLDEIEVNEYYRFYYRSLINSIDNLTLIFAKYTGEENRLANLDLQRSIIEKTYEYKVEDSSYLNSLLQLEFAKTKYDLQTFYLKHDNYNSLYHDYNHVIRKYNHDFSGIKASDLKALLKQNNSITPYKLEAYTQCEFRYLLQNLLKLDNYETNINMYLGNLSHKVLEEFTKNPSVDYKRIVDSFEDFPEELKYKERIFKTALKKELSKLLIVIGDFHKNTLFKEIKPEIKFRFPFKLDSEFDLSGIIDKVMVYQKDGISEYFVLIDYKLGSKDFSVEKFNNSQQLQLPMYYYAYKNLEDKKLKAAGFFYQSTSLGRYKEEPNAIIKNYRLKGVALEDKEVLESLNGDLTDIEGITITTKGKLSSRTRLLTESGFDELYQSVEEKIVKMIDGLKNGEFNINPVPAFGSKKDSISCEYCNYASICYNKNKQVEVKS